MVFLRYAAGDLEITAGLFAVVKSKIGTKYYFACFGYAAYSKAYVFLFQPLHRSRMCIGRVGTYSDNKLAGLPIVY